ncbi:OmpA family protein [bacterium]|nr:OmpA family protein [bacterium]MBU1989324.1 OmpA family protein [bacterium]
MLLAASMLSVGVYASDVLQKTAVESEFPYIQPVAVEEAPAAANAEAGRANKDSAPQTNEKAKSIEYTPPIEKDEDGDGVVDSMDLCPNTQAEFTVDGYGCPQTVTLKVHFASGEYAVNDTLIGHLKSFALFLKENKEYQIVIYGHTDTLGDSYQNKILSQNRANSVKEALIRYGIKDTRITSVGRGDADPIADNSTQEGRMKNRRIEVELIK